MIDVTNYWQFFDCKRVGDSIFLRVQNGHADYITAKFTVREWSADCLNFNLRDLSLEDLHDEIDRRTTKDRKISEIKQQINTLQWQLENLLK